MKQRANNWQKFRMLAQIQITLDFLIATINVVGTWNDVLLTRASLKLWVYRPSFVSSWYNSWSLLLSIKGKLSKSAFLLCSLLCRWRWRWWVTSITIQTKVSKQYFPLHSRVSDLRGFVCFARSEVLCIKDAVKGPFFSTHDLQHVAWGSKAYWKNTSCWLRLDSLHAVLMPLKKTFLF